MKSLRRDIKVIKYSIVAIAVMTLLFFVLIIAGTFNGSFSGSSKDSATRDTSNLLPRELKSTEQRAELANSIIDKINGDDFAELHRMMHPLLKTQVPKEELAKTAGIWKVQFGTISNVEEYDYACEESEEGTICTMRFAFSGANSAAGIMTLKTLHRGNAVARVFNMNLTEK